MTIRIFLFGAARIDVQGAAARGRAVQRHRLALISLVALAPGARLSREKLTAVLWPESGTEQARKLLSESIYVIRKELADDLLRSEGDDVVLSDAVYCDVIEFRRAVAAGDLALATQLYSAPLLDGLFIEGTVDLERILERDRGVLSRQYTDALVTLATRADSARDWPKSVEHWRALSAVDPYSARYAIGYAKALEASGERPSALRALAAYESLVKTDLDVDPDPEIATCARQMREGSAAVQTPRTDATPVIRSESVAQPNAIAEHAPAIHSVRSNRTFIRPLFVVGAVALMVLGYFAIQSRMQKTELERARVAQVAKTRRIAIPYFIDGSSDKHLQPYADGITDALIRQLSGISALQIVPRSGVAPLRGDSLDVGALARILDVGLVVVGRVTGTRDSLRLHVFVQDANTQTVLNAFDFIERIGGLFDLQDRVATSLSTFLRQQVGDEVTPGLLAHETKSVTAAVLVFRAEREHDDATYRFVSPADSFEKMGALRRADALFVQAQHEDQNWTRPGLGRASIIYDLAMQLEGAKRVERLRDAVALVEAAMKLAPMSASALEMHATLRWAIAYAEWDTKCATSVADSALVELDAAIARDSLLARAYATKSNILRRTGRYSEALRNAEIAVRTDAFLREGKNVLSQAIIGALSAGDLTAAREQCNEAHRRFPKEWRFVECKLNAMRYDTTWVDSARAWATLRQLDSLDAAPNNFAPVFRRMAIAIIDAQGGRREATRRHLNWADSVVGRSLSASTKASLEPFRAYLLFLLGRRDSAQLIAKRVVAENPNMAAYFNNDVLLRRIGITFATSPGICQPNTRRQP